MQENSVMEYIGREEHNEFARRVADEQHRQNRRIDELEENVKQNAQLTLSVEKLATSMENMTKEQMSQGERLEALEGRDGESWRKVKDTIIAAILGIIIGYIGTKIGF